MTNGELPFVPQEDPRSGWDKIATLGRVSGPPCKVAGRLRKAAGFHGHTGLSQW